MTAWIVWLIVAAALGVAELMTTTFALGLIAVAAIVAAGASALGRGCPSNCSPSWPLPARDSASSSQSRGGTSGSRPC